MFYEESIVTLTADSFDDAYAKAERYAKKQIDSQHINPLGQKVFETIYDLVDCFLVDEETEGVQEVYSSIKKNRTSLPEEEYIAVLADGCTTDEMKPLRYQ